MRKADTNDELANPYQTAVEILRLVQRDYRRAIEQLDNVSLYLGQREAATGKHLRTALEALEKNAAERNGSLIVADGQRSGCNSVMTSGETLAVPTLEVYCLGRFQVRVGCIKIDQWHSTKAKSLLKYLVGQRGHPVAKDILMEALWPGWEPSLANNNLKAAARALRQALGAAHGSNGDFAWILCQDGNYMINPAVDLWLDVDEFEHHWQTARRLEKQGEIAEAIKEHQTAESLYKGDYMEDNLYEEWTMLRREAVKDTYLAILGRLADYSMKQDDYEGCIVYCQKILTKDPCREDAYQRLMCCHSRLGQRSRAINWYRLCERTMKAELEVSPDARTVGLYTKLLSGEHI